MNLRGSQHDPARCGTSPAITGFTTIDMSNPRIAPRCLEKNIQIHCKVYQIWRSSYRFNARMEKVSTTTSKMRPKTIPKSMTNQYIIYVNVRRNDAKIIETRERWQILKCMSITMLNFDAEQMRKSFDPCPSESRVLAMPGRGASQH